MHPAQVSQRGRNARRFSTVTLILTAMVVTVLSGACSQPATEHARVSLLPSVATNGNSWQWDSACRFGPRTATACAAAGPNLRFGQIAGDAWNIGGDPSQTGSVTMSLNPTGGLEINGAFHNAPPCADATCIAPQANTWVRGYPSVLYGIDQCNAKTSPASTSGLQLPTQVSSIPANLVGTTTYDARPGNVTYDVAYDMWLNPSGTKTPCRSDGTIEVMVWTDYGDRALLPRSLQVGTTSVPFAVNGAVDPGDQAWTVYANNVFGNGHTVPWGGTVWLVLDVGRVVKKGTVTVDLGAALNAAGTLLQNNYGWADFANNYWLDTISFGMEFGPDNGDPYGAGPANFSLSLSSYCLETRTTVSAAAC
jgi:hypothetical protein